jgi:hypothetical protein
MTRPAFVSFLLALCLPAFAQTAPTVYPKLDRTTTRQALIVATVSDVTLMPNDICNKKVDENVVTICMANTLFHFKASLASTIYGDSHDPGFIVTSSHYGTQGYQDPAAPLLLLVHHDGKHSLLVRYARANLITNKAGKHYLPMLRPVAAHFLPCSVSELREEIVPDEFGALLSFKTGQVDSSATKENQEWLVPVEGGYRARYAIAMDRLQAHLGDLRPGIDEMQCPVYKKP